MMLGDSNLGRRCGVSRMASGRLCPTSTPWAFQNIGDLEALSEGSEDVASWFPNRSSDLAIFRYGSPERYSWIGTDHSVLRSAAIQWNETAGDIPEREEVLNPCWCDWEVEKDGMMTTCGAEFHAASALSAHRRAVRKCMPLVPSLVITNQCPWCLSSFATRI